jgi:hypothetical protein
MKYEITGGTHSFELTYVEGKKYMQLGIDLREPVIYIDEGVLSNWRPPFENEIISKEEKVKILKNIYKYLLRYNSSRRVILNDRGN